MADSSPITTFTGAPEKTGGNGGKFEYRSRRLGPTIGLEKLGCSLYVIPAGKRGFPYHAHSLIEELFVVLEGTGTLRHDGQEHPIKAGDVIAAPLGKAHQIVNSSDADLRYLAIACNEPADVVLYPDSGKVMAVSGAFGKTLWHMTKFGGVSDRPFGVAPAGATLSALECPGPQGGTPHNQAKPRRMRC